MKQVCAIAAWLLLAAMPAQADDSSAALKAGGLVLTRQADIRMAREDLFVSPKEVRVRYEFVNDAKSDVDTVVAFPMPDVDVRRFWYEPLGATLDASADFMGFALSVDGKPVQATLEQRAILGTSDVTAAVTAAGLPVNITQKGFVDTLDRMPAAARKKYAAQGIIEIDGSDAHPHWIARTRYWWRQRFPAGRTVVIAHRYQPVTGQFFFGESDLALKAPGYARDYCMDAGTRAAVRAKVAKLGENGPDGRYLLAYRTDFVLVTANNWKGPIGHFRLTLDKLKPDNVLSLCWDGGLKKTGATTFEGVRADFAPKRDIGLLVLQ